MSHGHSPTICPSRHSPTSPATNAAAQSLANNQFPSLVARARPKHVKLAHSSTSSSCSSSTSEVPDDGLDGGAPTTGYDVSRSGSDEVVPPRSSSRRSGKAAVESTCGGGRRVRTISTTSKSEDHIVTTESGKKVYTKGRPPWYDRAGKSLRKPYMIGICGGSASGKTTVAEKIIGRLEMQWVTLLSMDSFYRVLSEEQHELAARQEYNFDHPDAFDLELMHETLSRLKEGKSVEVPVYDFTTHSRDKNSRLLYGADILIFEGILSFHWPKIAALMDTKVFVDTDSDTRLARRLSRDITERGRDVQGVLEQYFRFVKPAFDSFIAPGSKVADIIIPRGGDNHVAIDLIVKQIKNQLAERGYDMPNHAQQREQLARASIDFNGCTTLPPSVHVLKQTSQVKGLHTIIRSRDTSRDDFIFYSERLMCLLVEEAMNYVPYEEVLVETPTGQHYRGCKKCDNICGVAIMRAGETLVRPLRAVIKDCRMGKILIQTNDVTLEPELYYLRLPKNIDQHKVLLMDGLVATGAAAMMAIRILLDHDVREENIILISLLMSRCGVHSIAYAFPKVRLITTEVDPFLSDQYCVIPGMGNFGDRYFGTEARLAGEHGSSEDADVESEENGEVEKTIEA